MISRDIFFFDVFEVKRIRDNNITALTRAFPEEGIFWFSYLKKKITRRFK